MPKDILLNYDNGYYDISFINGDFDLTEGLETAILMSLLMEKRASSSEVPRIDLRRGWWGNIVSNFNNYEIGSKLWLLQQSRRDITSLNLSKTFISDCFQWMIEDHIIDTMTVDVTFIDNGIKIDLTFNRSQNLIVSNTYILWDNTKEFSTKN